MSTMRLPSALTLCILALGCGNARPRAETPPPAPLPVTSTTVTLTEVPLAFERVAIPKEPGLDVMLFGELRPAFLKMIEQQAPGAKLGSRTRRSPSGKTVLAFAREPARVFVLDLEKGVIGTWSGDDAVYRTDDELVVRRGRELQSQPLAGAARSLGKAELCDATDCQTWPALLAANGTHALFALQSKGFVTSSSLASLSLHDGRLRELPGMPGAHLGLAVRDDGLSCTLQVPGSQPGEGAYLVCTRPPWTTVERFPVPEAGAGPDWIGREVFGGIVGHSTLLDPDRRTLRVLDTKRYRGLPYALPEAGLIAIETEEAYAVIDVEKLTVGVIKVPKCHTILGPTRAPMGAFVVSCEAGQDFEPALIKLVR
jgi:hypothetical protein